MKPASLVPLPIIEELFSQTAIDVVGLLPRNRSENPEAIPLKSVDVEHVAEELVRLFTRVRVPAEIFTDQGSHFM